MAVPITIPRLGWNMEEGTFVAWLKKEGDEVRPGDRVFSFESEKATEEVECLDSGILRLPPNAPKGGDRLPVGAVIGFLLQPGEEMPKMAETAPVAKATVAPAVATSSLPPAASPAVRWLARRQGIPLDKVHGTGPGGRVHPEDLRVPDRRTSSPRARRVAAELGLDWQKVEGTGRNGRVRERDVRSAVKGSAVPPNGTLIPHSATRRTIAARMVESLRNTAPVTLTTEADATALVARREQYRSMARPGPLPSYTDILIEIVGKALPAFPPLSGRWFDQGVWVPDDINIGLAVDTEAGLLVPVVRDVAKLDPFGIALQTRALAERARAGKLSMSDMQGGCFTISNLGGFGIDGFTPIINYPESAVLGVGRIVKRPAVVGDAVVPRDQITLSLTFDHRVVDGAPAARFLQAVVRAIEADEIE